MKCAYDLIMKVLEPKVEGVITPKALGYIRKALPRATIEFDADQYGNEMFLDNIEIETTERIKDIATDLWCKDTYKAINESFGIHRPYKNNFAFKSAFGKFKPFDGIDIPLRETLHNILWNETLMNSYGDSNLFEYKKEREFTIKLCTSVDDESNNKNSIGHYSFKSSFKGLVRFAKTLPNNGTRYLKEHVSNIKAVGIGEAEGLAMLTFYAMSVLNSLEREEEWNYSMRISYLNNFKSFFPNPVRTTKSFIIASWNTNQ